MNSIEMAKAIETKKDIEDFYFHVGYINGALSRPRLKEALLHNKDGYDQVGMKMALNMLQIAMDYFKEESAHEP